jgi:hypothetical protein
MFASLKRVAFDMVTLVFGNYFIVHCYVDIVAGMYVMYFNLIYNYVHCNFIYLIFDTLHISSWIYLI